MQNPLHHPLPTFATAATATGKDTAVNSDINDYDKYEQTSRSSIGSRSLNVLNELVSATEGLGGNANDSLGKSWVASDSSHTFYSIDDECPVVPNMWTKDFVGLYAQYAAVGLLYGTSGALLPFCVYVYDGAPNICANSANIVFFAWNFKIFFAILTDIYRPFGMRRKPWMLFAWGMVLVILLILALFAHTMTASVWLTLLLLMQGALMFSDVPADGYSVELGQLESPEQRGQILATGQRIRFTFSIVAGVIQTLLINGPGTNAPGCEIAFNGCWEWGLSVNGYYGLIFALVFVLAVPVWWLREIDPSSKPVHSFKDFCYDIWLTLQNLTTLYLLIFVVGVGCFTNFVNNVNIFLQYYIIDLTNFEAGVDTVTSYGALVVAIWLFQTYLINRNWRYTQYGSTIIASLFGLLWIPAYYNLGGTMNPWYTIFIDLDQSFVNGLSQVLFSLSVIELAKPGQEATTYELLITVANAAGALSGIFATQLLHPLKSTGCTDDDCPSNSVDISSVDAYYSSNGPERFRNYTLVLIFTSCFFCLCFTPFLPKDKAQCAEWKKLGMQTGDSASRGYVALALACSIVSYGFIVAVLLLDSDTSCLEGVGGTGC